MQQVSWYELMLSRCALNILRCHIMIPATFIARKVQERQEVHDCTVHPPDKSARAEEDPIPNSRVMFVDSSSVIDQEQGLGIPGPQ